jgi:hypothetical protein
MQSVSDLFRDKTMPTRDPDGLISRAGLAKFACG